MEHLAFKRLPKKLNVCFQLWLAFGGTPFSPYYDIDNVMIEHKKRGFNCIRIDSCAGLIHDINGNLREPFYIDEKVKYGKFEPVMRQAGCIEGGVSINLFDRIIKIFEMAKKHDMYIILSSWYYLHTYWLHEADSPLANELFGIPKHERIKSFAIFLHYIIKELENRGLADRIVVSEIFNEFNDLPFMNGFGGQWSATKEDLAMFKKEHEDALEFLMKEHPDQLFAYDSGDPCHEDNRIPSNMQVYNFHAYFMWNLYNEVMDEHPEWQKGQYTADDVAFERKGRYPMSQDWYKRVAEYNNLDDNDMSMIEQAIEDRFARDYDKYRNEMIKKLNRAIENAKGVPIIFAEGVSYVASKKLLWEEKSNSYWKLIDEMMDAYKNAGLWGTIIRCNCGMEDPSWNVCPEKLIKANKRFLED